MQLHLHKIKNALYLLMLLSLPIQSMENAESLVSLTYNQQKIQLPLSVVKKSKALACHLKQSEDIGDEIEIAFDKLNAPLEHINQVKEILVDIYDGSLTEIVSKPAPVSLIQLVDWLDIPLDDQPYQFRNTLRTYVLNCLHHTTSLEYDNLLQKFAKELNIKLVEKDAHIFGKDEQGCIRLTIRKTHEDNKYSDKWCDTSWGTHLYLPTKKARDLVQGLRFVVQGNENDLNLNYYAQLFSNLHTLSVQAEDYEKESYTGSKKTRTSLCFLSYPLLKSLGNTVQNLQQLELNGVILLDPIPLAKLITDGKQLKKIKIKPKSEDEFLIIDTQEIENDNTTLQELSLPSCKLTAVPGLVKQLKALEKLDLTHNKISHISGEMFPQNLKKCKLWGNPIESVDDTTKLPHCALKGGIYSKSLETPLYLLSIFGATKNAKD